MSDPYQLGRTIGRVEGVSAVVEALKKSGRTEAAEWIDSVTGDEAVFVELQKFGATDTRPANRSG